MAAKAILATGFSTTFIQRLLPGIRDERLFFSFGEIIPDLSEFDVSVWTAGMWAARLQRIGLVQNVCSPGADWMPALDRELTGRKIVNGKLAQLANDERRLWVKPAEAKVPAFVAGLYTLQEIEQIFEAESLSPDLELQWTESIIPFDWEHRFFVTDGEVTTGSPYRVAGRSWEPTISWARYDEAEQYAKRVVQLLAQTDMLPPHFTLDVGLDVANDRWLIVEGNRSWSSGVYSCDPRLALDSIYASSHYVGDRWCWKPDAQIVAQAAEKPLLEVLPVDSGSIGFAEFNRF